MIRIILSLLYAACLLPVHGEEEVSDPASVSMPADGRMPFYQWDRLISRLLPEQYSGDLILTEKQEKINILPAGDLEYIFPDENSYADDYSINHGPMRQLFAGERIPAGHPVIMGETPAVLLHFHADLLGSVWASASMKRLEELPVFQRRPKTLIVQLTAPPGLEMKSVRNILQQLRRHGFEDIALSHPPAISNLPFSSPSIIPPASRPTVFSPNYPKFRSVLVPGDINRETLTKKLMRTIVMAEDIHEFHLHPQFTGKTLVVPRLNPARFFEEYPWGGWDGEGEPPPVLISRRCIFYSAIAFPTGTWLGGTFYAMGEEEALRERLRPGANSKVACILLKIDPRCRMQDIWPHLSLIFHMTANRVMLLTSDLEPRREWDIQRPEHPVDVLPEFPSVTP